MAASKSPRPAFRTGHDAEARLEVLICDYEQCRQDERALAPIQVTLLSIGSTILGLLAAATTQTCQVRKEPGCIKVPDYLLATAPLLPLTLFSFLYMVGTAATVRSYYMRGLEEELRSYAAQPIAALGDIPPASLEGLTTEVTSFRRGRLRYRVIAAVTLLSLVFLFGGLTIYIAVHLSMIPGVITALFYGAVFLILLSETIDATMGGRRLFQAVGRKYLNGRDLPQIHALPNPSASPVKERKLWSYIALPRPGDMVKWLILPGAWVIVSWPSARLDTWPRLLLLLFVFEYLIYEARYQWNDVRGLEDDQHHPERDARARLPVGQAGEHAARNIAISLTFALFRLGAALVIGYRFGIMLPVIALIVIVFPAAGLYEAFRDRATEVSDSLVVPRVVLGLWLVVGVGYAVRAGVGFAVAGLPLASWQAVVAIVGFAAFGIMFVLLTWVLEASSNCQFSAAEIWYMLDGLKRKPHIASLLKYVNLKPAEASTASPGSIDLSGDKASSTYGGARPVLAGRNLILAPWNIAATSGLTLEGIFVLSVIEPHASIADFISMGISGIMIGVLLATSRKAVDRAAVVIGGATVQLVLVVKAGADWPLWVIAVIPTLAIAGVYAFFCSSTYSEVTGFLPDLTEAVKGVRASCIRGFVSVFTILVGRSTWSRYISRAKTSP